MAKRKIMMKHINNITWRQHRIPQFILNNFNTNNGLILFDTTDKSESHRNPKNIFYEEYYFSNNKIENHEIIKETEDSLEHTYNKAENEFAQMLSTKILDNKTAITFMVDLYCKTNDKFAIKIAKDYLEIVKKELELVGKDYGYLSEDFETDNIILKWDTLKNKRGRYKLHLKNIYKELKTISDELAKFDYSKFETEIIEAKCNPLILGDSPVCWNEHLSLSGIGMPISPNEVIICYDKSYPLINSVRKAIENGLDICNQQVQCSKRFIVYNEKAGINNNLYLKLKSK